MPLELCTSVFRYVEAVFPGSYGIPKPFYFPFTKSYWCGASADNVIEVGIEQVYLLEIQEVKITLMG